MSLLKANAVQLGQSLTASQNFTWYQPATPDGTVRLGNGNSGSVTDLVTLTSAGNLGVGTTAPAAKLDVIGIARVNEDGAGTKVIQLRSNYASLGPAIQVTTNDPLLFLTNNSEKMRLDSSGNLGLGVTPSAWISNRKAIEIGGSYPVLSFSGSATSSEIITNAYWNASGTLTRVAAGYVGYMDFNNYAPGGFTWQLGSNGAAGAAVSATRAMTLDASGKLGVGSTSPQFLVSASTNSSSGAPSVQVTPQFYAKGYAGAAQQYAGIGFAMYEHTNGYWGSGILARDDTGSYGSALAFYTSTGSATPTPTERARIDSSGNLLVGQTTSGPTVTGTSIAPGGYVTSAFNITSYNQAWVLNNNNASGTTFAAIEFRQNNVAKGSISVSSTATAYNTSSDQRLKEHIVDAPSALSSVNAIKVRSFDWKADGSHVDYGYIAQELLEVAPEAVHVPADPEEMMGVDFGKLTPRLVKAIQELSAELNELKQKVNA